MAEAIKQNTLTIHCVQWKRRRILVNLVHCAKNRASEITSER